MTFHKSFQERLKALKMTKTEFGQNLGLSPTTVSQWKDSPPRYAIAYLDLFEIRKKEWENENDVLLGLLLLRKVKEVLED